jgi:hypothetical protein
MEVLERIEHAPEKRNRYEWLSRSGDLIELLFVKTPVQTSYLPR